MVATTETSSQQETTTSEWMGLVRATTIGNGLHHTFTVEALGVNLEIPALKSRRIAFDAPPVTYEFVCTVPGHESMTGTLIVEG